MKNELLPFSMLKLFISLFTLLIFSGCTFNNLFFNEPEVKQEKKLKNNHFKDKFLIAVIKPHNGSDHYYLNQETLHNAMIDAVYSTDSYRVVERTKMELLLDEMKLSESGIITRNSVDIGRLLGVDAVMIVRLESINYSIKQAMMLEVKQSANVRVSGRLIDVETAEVIVSTSFKDTITHTQGILKDVIGKPSINVSKEFFIEDSVIQAFKKLAFKLSEKTPKRSVYKSY